MIVDMKALIHPLPVHILREIQAGNTANALEAIDCLLINEKTPQLLKERLEIEKERMKRQPLSYPHTEQKALLMLQELDSAYTLADLKALCAQGLIDWRYIDGEPRYFVRFLRSLIKTHKDFAQKANAPFSPHSDFLDPVIKQINQKGKSRYQITIAGKLTIEPQAFIPNEQYTIQIPIPADSAQTQNIQLAFKGLEPTVIDAPSCGQRTACYQVQLAENQPIRWEYTYEQTIHKVDFSAPPKAPYYCAPAPEKEDLHQELPHIVFSPYLKNLAATLIGSETNPLAIARIFYDYITTQVQYSFMPEYFLIDDIAASTAYNHKGDCGLQALLFITLCRIAGIPARWQSGLAIDGSYVGSHDWAQFYVEPWGWLFCDCSYGGGAYRKGNRERWNFYFGHLDPFRMVANRTFQGAFEVPKSHWRVDPYDNQTGECECSQKPFTAREFDTTYTLVELKELC